MTPLYRAVLSNAFDVCRILIRSRADVNMRRVGSGNSCNAESPLIRYWNRKLAYFIGEFIKLTEELATKTRLHISCFFMQINSFLHFM